jgi:RimJ/RimL family protein N-acetyltransferase
MTDTTTANNGSATPQASLWTGGKVLLRAYEPGDWEAERLFANSADERSGWKVWPPRSVEADKKWSQDASLERPEGDALVFRLAIARREDAAIVGSINVHTVDQTNGTFSYGVAVLSAYKGNGYAGEAILLIMRYMFDERRFQKCESGVCGYNSGSLALHRKLGFAEEGRLRRHVFVGGQYHDEVRFGMTVEEFHERHPGLKLAL